MWVLWLIVIGILFYNNKLTLALEKLLIVSDCSVYYIDHQYFFIHNDELNRSHQGTYE